MADVKPATDVETRATCLFRYLNHLNEPDPVKRADLLMESTFDGAHIGPTNRLNYRDALATQFRDYQARIDAERAARERAEAAPIARPLDEWHEDFGPVLWWKFPIEEPPYVGSPLDTDWPDYHTHWTPIRCPEQPQIALKEPSNG